MLLVSAPVYFSCGTVLKKKILGHFLYWSYNWSLESFLVQKVQFLIVLSATTHLDAACPLFKKAEARMRFVEISKDVQKLHCLLFIVADANHLNRNVIFYSSFFFIPHHQLMPYVNIQCAQCSAKNTLSMDTTTLHLPGGSKRFFSQVTWWHFFDWPLVSAVVSHSTAETDQRDPQRWKFSLQTYFTWAEH